SPIDSISRLSRASFSSVLRCSARSASNSWSRALSVSRLGDGASVGAGEGARGACADAAMSPSGKTPTIASTSERKTTGEGEGKATGINSFYAKTAPPEYIAMIGTGLRRGARFSRSVDAQPLDFPSFLRRNDRSRAMIGMPGQDGNGAIELLHEHDSNELMRPCRAPEGNGKACLFTQAGCEPVGSADDEYDRGLVLSLPVLQPAGDNGAAHVLAALVQDHRGCAVGHDIGDGDRFFEHAPGGIVGAALLDLDNVEGVQTDVTTGVGRAFAIALGELALRTLLQAADGGDHDAHA